MQNNVIDEQFLKSVKANARQARAQIGLSVPDIAITMVQTQLVNDIENGISDTNSKLDKVVELLEKILEAKASTKTDAETTKTVAVGKPVVASSTIK